MQEARRSQSKRDLVIVANRLPVRRVSRDGEKAWETSPGGLVSALKPVVQDLAAAWVGWSGSSGDALEPFELEGIVSMPVEVSRAELVDFYEGMCNSTLWPLYHDAVREPQYHRHWWRRYVAINRRFAAAASRVAAQGALVWVHDYHLQLVPGMLREARPDVRIGFFLHIPFPPPELFQRLPWRREILAGLMGADVVGLQTRTAVRNFITVAARFLDARASGQALVYGTRRVEAGAFPISIDVRRFETVAAKPEVIERARQIQRQLGGNRKLILGVDRLDYTKGIDVRLKAFHEWLKKDPEAVRRAVLVQVAVPSRERLPDYREMERHVQELVGRINGEFGEVGQAAVHYLHRSVDVEELVALYRAADVMLVTPLCDGMNLVAKEYVACRLDDTGVLVLSEFAGAARELKSALLVNPHDDDVLAESLQRAVSLPSEEAARRMRTLRRALHANTVQDWAERYLERLQPGRARRRKVGRAAQPRASRVSASAQ